MILSIDEVEQRFYQNLPVNDDDMVEIPYVINNETSFGTRSEPASVHYEMLKYVAEH